MRISDWSSDVCSSDLTAIDQEHRTRHHAGALGHPALLAPRLEVAEEGGRDLALQYLHRTAPAPAFGIEDRLARGDHSHVAGPQGAQGPARSFPAAYQLARQVQRLSQHRAIRGNGR